MLSYCLNCQKESINPKVLKTNSGIIKMCYVW